MRDRAIGLGMRLLLGVIGAAALGAGLLLAATQLRRATAGSPLISALLAAGVCGVVAVGGLVLLRGAVRGRIAVRRVRRPRR